MSYRSTTKKILSRNQGVSLLELLTTIALVGILAFIAIPSFRSTIQDNQLASCSNKLIAAIQYAKSEAINTRQQVSITFAEDNGKPLIQVGLDTDGNAATIETLEQELMCSDDDLEVDNDLGIGFLRFGPTGFRTDGQGPVVFQTCNDIGKGKNLSVGNSGSTSTADAPDGDC